MAIGRTFPNRFQKALRPEHGRSGLNCDPGERLLDELDDDTLVERAAVATPIGRSSWRQLCGAASTWSGSTPPPPSTLVPGPDTADRRRAPAVAALGMAGMGRSDWRRVKRLGFSDAQLAWLFDADEADVRAARLGSGVRATFKTVDTCGAEFSAWTPYHYSTYEDEDEVVSGDRRKVVILGAGPNRIGQGIEFDYCCVSTPASPCPRRATRP